MNFLKYIIASIFITLSVFGYAQNEDKVPPEILVHMERGAKLMNGGAYEEADKAFKIVLDNANVIPDEICYFFGVNSYHLEKYKQSINWLSKYLELKGTSGQYSDECEDWLDKAKAQYQVTKLKEESNINSLDSTSQNTDFSTDIDCGPSGKIVCPVCNGTGVIIRTDKFGKVYSTCPYSDKYGYMSCEDYNLLLKGELKVKSTP